MTAAFLEDTTVLEAVELTVDVTDAAGLGASCQIAATVHLPEPEALSDPPIVCFAFPGGGYSRRYYSFDMPDASGGGQAGWHTQRGWVVATIDHLGVGESTVPEPDTLTYETVARADVAAVQEVMARLEKGALAAGFSPITGAVKLGIGQSMGGCFLIVAQGQHTVFDGIGVLGYSAIHTIVPSRPGQPPVPMPWMPRGSNLAEPIILNAADLAAGEAVTDQEALDEMRSQGEHPFRWAFHFDDEPAEVIAEDLATDPNAPLPRWRSATTPACAIFMVAPGTVSAEAAVINVPVFIATGERDVVPDPWMEPKAFKSATDITLAVFPRMAHMHNFANTREQLWARLHHWGSGVAGRTSGASKDV